MDKFEPEKVLGDVSKNFEVMGSHRVHNWYAYAIIGIVLGMAVGIIYVINRQGQFDASRAAEGESDMIYPGESPAEGTTGPTDPTIRPNTIMTITKLKKSPHCAGILVNKW